MVIEPDLETNATGISKFLSSTIFLRLVGSPKLIMILTDRHCIVQMRQIVTDRHFAVHEIVFAKRYFKTFAPSPNFQFSTKKVGTFEGSPANFSQLE